MKKALSLFFLLGSLLLSSQKHNYKAGEYLIYRVHYGVFNAGFASLEVKNTELAGRPVFHVVGKGWTTGIVSTFFEVADNYESYIDQKTSLPSKFIRKINEGDHVKDKELLFNHLIKNVYVHDKKSGNKKYFTFNSSNIQDLVSAFYRLRDYNNSRFKISSDIYLNVFFDEEEYEMKMSILGREDIKTKFGKISCVKLRPYVQSGRVFKEQESLTVWVTDDENHVPIRIKAKLAVGALKADLEGYKNLKYTIHFK